MKTKYIGLIMIVGAVLAGCGGSSSSSSSASGSSAQAVAITSSNQSTITSTALSSATQGFSGTTYLSSVGAQTNGTTASSDERSMTNLANLAFDQFIKHQNDPLSVIGATASGNCGTDSTYGTATFSTDGSSTTPYTYFTITFNNCVIYGTPSSGIKYNGSLSMSGMTVTRNASSVITGITATFSFDLTTTDTTTSTTHTGKINAGFTIAATGIGSSARTDSITGTKYNVSYDAYWVTLSDFSFTSTYDNTTALHGYSDTVNYTIASDAINAGFTFTTVNALVRNYGDTKPRSGQVVISGASNTKLRVTVLAYDAATNPNAGTVNGKLTLELDQGTGLGYGTPVTKTWATL